MIARLSVSAFAGGVILKKFLGIELKTLCLCGVCHSYLWLVSLCRCVVSSHRPARYSSPTRSEIILQPELNPAGSVAYSNSCFRKIRGLKVRFGNFQDFWVHFGVTCTFRRRAVVSYTLSSIASANTQVLRCALWLVLVSPDTTTVAAPYVRTSHTPCRHHKPLPYPNLLLFT